MPRRIFTVAALALALAFGALSPASAMTTDEAGQYFLTSVCPGRAKAVKLNRVVFHGKRNFTAKQMHGKRLRQARRAIAAMATAEANAAASLRTPPSAWPSQDAADAVSRTANALARESEVLKKLRSKSGQLFRKFWNRQFIPANQAFADASTVARTSLGPPADPRAGC